MKRFLAPAIIASAAVAVGGLALAARDPQDSGHPSSTASTTVAGSRPDSTATVTITEIDGVGAVLTDAQGRVLYSPDEEHADPDVVCTDTCEQFWAPLPAPDQAPTGPGVTDLNVADRPDGTRQVTFQGRRLYTFTQEGPGEASGDGLADNFGDQRFTWHAVRATPTDPTATGTGTPTDTERDVPDYPGY